MRVNGIRKLAVLMIFGLLAWAGIGAAAEIPSGMFVDDAGLHEIVIYESVEKICSEAFSNCENLRLVKCLSRDVEIAEDAFVNCANLTILCNYESTMTQYAKAHGIPCQYLDAFQIECDTKNNGCAGLPVTWTVTSIISEADESSAFSYRLLCGAKVVEEGELSADMTFTHTPRTEGQYTFLVTVRNSVMQTTLSAETLPVAAKLTLGTYEQDRNAATADPIEWKILAVEGDKALVISEKILRVNSYFNPSWIKYKYTYWSGSYIGTASSVNYRGSAPESESRKITGITPTSIPLQDGSRGTESDLYSLHARYWCNDVFYWQAFSKEERERILLTHNTNEDNAEYNVAGGPDTDDYVFFLSYNELMTYMPNTADRVAALTAAAQRELGSGQPVLWWLRTPGKFRVNAMYVYGANGSVSTYGSDVGHSALGYRPAMWVTIGG